MLSGHPSFGRTTCGGGESPQIISSSFQLRFPLSLDPWLLSVLLKSVKISISMPGSQIELIRVSFVTGFPIIEESLIVNVLITYHCSPSPLVFSF
jgi:hypothetical protein